MKKLWKMRVLALFLCLAMLFSGLLPGQTAEAASGTDVRKAIDICYDYYYRTLWKNGSSVPDWTDGSELIIAGMKESGYKASAAFYTAYWQKLKKSMKTVDPAAVDVLDWAKLVIVIHALGHKPSEIKTVNILKQMCRKTAVKKSGQQMKYALILQALDCGNYQVPSGSAYLTRAALIKKLSSDIMKFSSESKMIDYPVMYAQPLARYYKTNAAAKKAVKKALSLIRKNRNSSGGIGSPDNVWSEAQALILLGAMGIHPETSQAYLVHGHSITDAVLKYFNLKAGTTEITFDPAQVARGLNAGL